jgi:hypothetical protein
MWRSVVGQNIAKNVDSRSDDEWDSDPNFVVSCLLFFLNRNDRLNNRCLDKKNDITEKEQRWGSKAIEGSGRLESIK